LRRALPALFDAADAFVLASAWEGMPLAAGEAMAMEKPVIATNAGGTRELVGNAGVIVPVKAPDALAAAMLELMEQSPEARQAMGRAARERIAADFSMDTTADAWEHLYRCVLNPES
jgi:glycosyltransferase involved in cell wall biosynthesis